MTNEQKQLLLKDLCARLPYGVKVQIKANNCTDGINTLNLIDLNSFIKNSPRDEDWYDVVTSIKPYLRPMSSMTEEELKWYYNKLTAIEESRIRRQKHIEELNDWLNAHHFDFRNLIPMGLALLATEGMYND